MLQSVPPVVPSPHVKERLLKRIAAEGRAGAPSRASAGTGRWGMRRWVEALAAGAVAAAIAVGVLWPLVQRDRQTIASLREELGRQREQIRQLRQAVQHHGEMIELFRSPAVQLVGVQGTPEQPQARGRVFWDQANRA